MKKIWAIMVALVLIVSIVGTQAQYISDSNDGGFSLSIIKKGTCNLTIQGVNLTYNSTSENPFDVYVNGILVADDAWSYAGSHARLNSYQIVPEDGSMVFLPGTALEGTLPEENKSIKVYFYEQNSYCVDLNTDDKCRADIYADGIKVAPGYRDYWFWHYVGTEITCKNIIPLEGYEYIGPEEFTFVIADEGITFDLTQYIIPVS